MGWRVECGGSGGASTGAPVEAGRVVAKTPERVLAALAAHPEGSLAEVAARLGKSLRAVERAARQLQQQGRLRFVGPRKGGRWEVS